LRVHAHDRWHKTFDSFGGKGNGMDRKIGGATCCIKHCFDTCARPKVTELSQSKLAMTRLIASKYMYLVFDTCEGVSNIIDF
jgi:hypothetical protein